MLPRPLILAIGTAAGAVNLLMASASVLSRVTEGRDVTRPADGRAERTEVRSAPFWQQNGARVDRVQGRLFVGGATDNDAAYPNRAMDWLAALQTSWGHEVGYTTGGMANVLTDGNPSSAYAIIGAAQTRYFKQAGAAIGTQGYGICNGDRSDGHCWGFYGEAHRVEGAGSAYGMELDPIGHERSIDPSPRQQGNLIGLQLACGGDYKGFRPFPCSAAIQVAPNPAMFSTAINVMAGAIIAGRSAIQLPAENGISFYSGSGVAIGKIDADRVSSRASRLHFGDGAVAVQPALRLVPATFGELPPCTDAARGTIGFIADAKEKVTTWHQAVTAGGGRYKAFVSCNGEGWHAFDY